MALPRPRRSRRAGDDECASDNPGLVANLDDGALERWRRRANRNLASRPCFAQNCGHRATNDEVTRSRGSDFFASEQPWRLQASLAAAPRQTCRGAPRARRTDTRSRTPAPRPRLPGREQGEWLLPHLRPRRTSNAGSSHLTSRSMSLANARCPALRHGRVLHSRPNPHVDVWPASAPRLRKHAAKAFSLLLVAMCGMDHRRHGRQPQHHRPRMGASSS